jgi:type IV fimbrial biogenesis protein FimT
MLSAPNRVRTHSSGFSLVELVIVVAIVAISMALGLQGIQDWIQSARIRTAAEGVLNGLQAARAEAIRSNASIAFTLSSPGTASGTGWSITEVRTGDAVQSKSNGEGSIGATLTVTPDEATTVTFNGLGRRAIANKDLTPVLTSVTVNGSLRITISAGGEVRMCNPAVASSTGDPTAC